MNVKYEPKNIVATYTDQYGDERVIHSPRGPNGALRRAKMTDTPALRMNRAVAILLGQNIRKRRTELGLSARDVCLRAGITYTDAKQFIYKLEKAFRSEGVRLGTLYALAIALECSPADLMPTVAEVMAGAGVSSNSVRTLEAA